MSIETERESLNLNELTSTEKESITDVTSYILNSVATNNTFQKEFEPNRLSQVVEYSEEINSLPFGYNNQIENFERPYIGEISWGDQAGVIVETIDFSLEEGRVEKRNIIPIEELLKGNELFNQGLIDVEGYRNFSQAIEYLSKSISSKESLVNFLDNPGFYFRKNEHYKAFSNSGKEFTFHEKNIKLSEKELKHIKNWKYISNDLFLLLEMTFFASEGRRNDYISRIVGNDLSNRYLNQDSSYRGAFTTFSHENTSLIMIVTKK